MGRTARSYLHCRYPFHFNSLAPCGANHMIDAPSPHSTTFQLTRPVWGEPLSYNHIIILLSISTHSPRVGRTQGHNHKIGILWDFNSLAPCGANPVAQNIERSAEKFQLTRPVWGEPSRIWSINSHRGFQLTRPVWGEPNDLRFQFVHFFISTHSPRVGRTFSSLI